MKDDVELLKEYAQARSEDAFAELVRRHLPLVYSAAMRQVGGDQALAKDVAQTVFIALARKAAALSRQPPLAGWLYISTRFAASNAVRQEQRRRVRERKAIDMQEPFGTSAPEPAWEALSPVLDEAMAQLDVTDRHAVLLRFFECKQLKAVGAALEMTEDAARMRISRALERLRTLLEQRGVVISATALGAALAEEAVGAAPAGLAPAVSAAAVAGAAAGVAALPPILRVLTKSKAKAAVIGAIVVAGVVVPLALKRQPQPPQVEVAQQNAALPPATPLMAGSPPAAGEAPPPQDDPSQPPASPLVEPEPAMPMPQPAPGELPPQPLLARPRMPQLAQRPRPAPLPPLAGLAPTIGVTRSPRQLSVAAVDPAHVRVRPAQFVPSGITNAAVMKAMRNVPQSAFVLSGALTNAFRRTLESPLVVANVAECLEPQPTDRVLQLGTGSGYETAVLAELVQAVYSVEPQAELVREARANLERYGYTNNVSFRQGDLALGWPEASPFDKMVFNGDPDQLSSALINQLKPGGRLVIATEEDNQVHVFEKAGGRLIPTYDRRLGPMPIRLNAAGASPGSRPIQLRPPEQPR